MATEKEEIIIQVTTDGVKDAEKQFEGLSDSIDDSSKSTKELNKESKSFGETMAGLGGGIGSAFTLLSEGAQKGVGAMRTLGGAIAASGIGLLLVAVASLKTYFEGTEAGAKDLEKIMAVLGSTMEVIGRILGDIGTLIVGVFKDPLPFINKMLETVKGLLIPFNAVYHSIIAIGKALKGDFAGAAEEFKGIATDFTNSLNTIKEGFEGATDAIGNYITEIEKAGVIALEIAARQRTLREAIADDRIEDAANEVRLSELRERYTDQENLSLEKRQKAFNEYSKIRLEDAKGQIDLAEQAREIARLQYEEAFKNDRDILKRKEAIAEADEKYFKDIAAVAELRRFLNKEERRLIREAEADAKAIRDKEIAEKKAIADANAKLLEETNKLRLAEIAKQTQAEIDQSRASAEEILVLKILQAEQLALAEKEARDKAINESLADEETKDIARKESELAREQDFKNARIALETEYEEGITAKQKEEEDKRTEYKKQSAKDAQSIATSLSSILETIGLKDSKAAKALGIANLAVNTGEAVSNTMVGITKALASSPPPFNFISASAVGATGAALIASNVAKASALLKAPAPSSSIQQPISNATASVNNEVKTSQTNPSQSVATLGFQSRVYVTESDLRNSRSKTDVVEAQARL